MAAVLKLIAALIIIFGVINLVRMSFFMIGSDIYGLWNQIRRRKKSSFLPSVSVVIPAYNEEKSVLDCVTSVLKSDYPKNYFEVIVVNDGSADSTKSILENFAAENPSE